MHYTHIIYNCMLGTVCFKSDLQAWHMGYNAPRATHISIQKGSDQHASWFLRYAPTERFRPGWIMQLLPFYARGYDLQPIVVSCLMGVLQYYMYSRICLKQKVETPKLYTSKP